MSAAKGVKSRVTASKRVPAGTAPDPIVAVPHKPSAEMPIVELKIAMLPHAAAPSAAHWQSFAASIARVANRGYLAPTVRVDADLRGATVRIGGWDAATAIRMVGLYATNSPSPQLWQSHNYEVSVIPSGELLPSH